MVIQQLCAVNGYLYFNGTNVASGTELWRTDGTTAGTKLFADIVKGPTSSDPVALTKVGNTLYFIATTADYGRELWKLDSGASAPVFGERYSRRSWKFWCCELVCLQK